MDYTLNIGAWNSVFAVPSSVVDKYIKLASGDSVKLLLWLLRHGGESFTAERLKEELGFDEPGELEDSALFWVQRGIIRAETDRQGLKLFPAAETPETAVAAVPQEPEKIKQTITPAKPAAYTSGEIAKCIKESPEMQMLFSEAEKMFAHPLRPNEQDTVMKITNHYGLPCDVALMLLGFCSKNGKLTPAYILKIAENWAADEILTVRLADERILAVEKQDGVEKRICEKLGLSSKLSASVRNLIKVWSVDWNFSEEMIVLAYDKTVENTGKWAPAYANTILENWRNNGVSTPDGASKLDESFKNALKPKTSRKAPSTPSSFSTDALKKKILENYKRNNEN